MAVLFALPVPPGQDLPQHLAFARIFLDYGDSALFTAFYRLPPHLQPYQTTHLLVAALARPLGIVGAVRVLLALYAIGTLAGFHALARACSPRRAVDDSPPWAGLLGGLLVFNPELMMGFLPYALCQPLFLFAAALLARSERHRDTSGAMLLAPLVAAMASLHVAAAGFCVIVATVHAAVAPSAARVKLALSSLAGVAGAMIAWRVAGELGTGGVPLDVREAIKGAHGLEFVNDVFRVTWTDLPVKLNFLLWHAFGPYRLAHLVPPILATAALVLLVVRARRSPVEGRSPLLRTGLTMALLAWLAPFGVEAPSEFSFIDFRLLGLALPLLLASIPDEWLAPPRTRSALVAFALSSCVYFAAHAAGFAAEARPVLALLERARPTGVLRPIVFHNRSAWFGKTFQLTHFLPTYYTAVDGGITTQFWGRYTAHLPIDYRPGKRFEGAPDWTPEKTTAADFARVDWILFQSACDDDMRFVNDNAARTRALVEAHADRVTCDGLWCLYRVRH